jgi:tetratricopeptide (TPR) repeat protein
VNGHAETRAKFIPRAEEQDIKQQLSVVQADRKSRVVLLYGSGGVGKTSLVRQMARDNSDDMTVWLDRIDVDDTVCWLLSNLESRVASQLDPDNVYFGEYRRQLSQLPSSTRAEITHETIVSHLGRIKEVFAACYKEYVTAEKKTVVIVFDTVETIRGTNLLLTLAQWMKALPLATLFILSGRPLASDHNGQRDQIVTELDSPYQGIPVTTIGVGGFTPDATREYIRNSGISNDLIGQEEDKLVLLSQGHPLWLAFMIDYLQVEGVPPEATQQPLDYLEQQLPFDHEMTAEGRRLREAFLRRLVAPYRETDFWHEAIKRLAVVRQPVAKTVWQQLMSDRMLPDDVSSIDEAWQVLLSMPWIRPRGNRQYVTLHDAVAEEFAQRLFPLHDQDQRWRHGIWHKALGIYRSLAADAEAELEPKLASLDEALRRFDPARTENDLEAAPRERDLMDQSVQLDGRMRELDQLKAASLYYLFLTDYEQGCHQLLDSFAEAERQHDSFFQDLLVLYLERFLPGGSHSEAFNDIVKAKLDEFRGWLEHEQPQLYIALGIMVAKYLVEASQSEDALKFLARLPEEAATFRQLHDLYILRGNACLRVPGKVKDGEGHFTHAINHAEGLNTPDRHKFIAQAYKERGFYCRNTGQWSEADLSYRHAWETIVKALSADSHAEDRKEMASIQTNWAYVKGLGGSYRDGLELVESAITIRQQMKEHADAGMSWSVCGEVYRYARRFEKAWAAYAEAERHLQGRRYWGRLGFIYQEQAICLHQASQDGIRITRDPAGEARERIAKALDLCLAHSIRGYPSALNRAGRIIGFTNPDVGLKYLEDGINEAQRISDGWFWFANLVEYTELSYRQWRRTRRPEHRANIIEKSGQIDQVAEDYSFSDLRGRWSLLQAHLAVNDYFDAEDAGDTGDADKRDGALDHYESGFVNLAKRHVGSSGTASLKGEFATFQSVIAQLPYNVQMAWQAKLRSAWAAAGDVSTVLLARLEELYRPAG